MTEDDDHALVRRSEHLDLLGVPQPLFEELCNLLGRDAVEAALERVASRELASRMTPACIDCGLDAEVATKRFEMLCASCAAERERARMAQPSSPPPGVLTSALMRARRRRVPATLAKEAWVATVRNFHDRCAYCGGPWCVIDHATGMGIGGGTTKYNCLPACDECVCRKGHRTIEQLRGVAGFDRDRLEAAIAWLVHNGRPITKG